MAGHDLAPIFLEPVVLNYITTISVTARLHFDLWRIARHQDDVFDAEQSRRQSHGLGMVARGKSDDSCVTLLLGEVGEGVVGTAELKSSNPLKILTFEKHFDFGSLSTR